MQDTLGILVHSTHYFEHVHMLARAAIAKGKRVHIHLLQEGVLFVREKTFHRLCQLVQVTICEKSAADLTACHQIESIPSLRHTSSRNLVDILTDCDRWVTF